MSHCCGLPLLTIILALHSPHFPHTLSLPAAAQALHIHLHLGDGEDVVEVHKQDLTAMDKYESMHLVLGPRQYDNLIAACTGELCGGGVQGSASAGIWGSVHELPSPALLKSVKLPFLLFPSRQFGGEQQRVRDGRRKRAGCESPRPAQVEHRHVPGPGLWAGGQRRPLVPPHSQVGAAQGETCRGGGQADEAFCFWPNATPLDGIVRRLRLRTGRRGGTPHLRLPRPHPYTHR